MSDRSRTTHSGIGLPDPTLRLWREESTATEAGPRAGLPVPAAATLLALQTSGPQTEAIEVRSARGGFPSRDTSGSVETTQAAGLIWRPIGGQWRGWDPPRTLSRWELLDANLATGDVVEDETTLAVDPDAIMLEDGTLLVVYERHTEDGSGNTVVQLFARRRRPGEDDDTTVVESASSYPARLRPTLARLANGRILLYRYLVRGTYSGLRWWYSDDDGETWAHGGDGAVDESIAFFDGTTLTHPARMRVRRSGAQMLLMVMTTDPDTAERVILQYASSDLGNHFQRIHIASSSDAARDEPGDVLDLTATPGGGFVVLVGDYFRVGSEDGGAKGVSVGRLPDAYQRIDQAEWTRLNDRGAGGYLAIDEGGELLALVEQRIAPDGAGTAPTRTDLEAFASYDSGLSWSNYFRLPGVVYKDFGGEVLSLRGIPITNRGALALGRGRGAFIPRWSQDGTGTRDWRGTLGLAWLGGWSGLTRPLSRASETELDSIGWTRAYVPIQTPDEYEDWTEVKTGASGLSLILGDELSLATSTADNEIYYRWTLTTPQAVRARTVATRIGYRVLAAESRIARITIPRTVDRTDALRADVAVSASAITLTGTTIMSAGFSPTGTDMEIEIEVTRAPAPLARVWYRPRTDSEDKAWSGPLEVTPTVVATTDYSVEVGLGEGSGDAIRAIRFKEWVSAVQGAGVQSLDTLPSGGQAPSGLQPRLAAGRPYIGRGVYLTARQGPAYRSDLWRIDPDPDFSLARATDDPSPRVVWQSTDLAQQRIALSWQGKRSEVLAISLRNCNLGQVVIQERVSGAWLTVGSATLWEDIPFSRTGAVLRPGVGADGRRYDHDELRGAFVNLAETSVARRIVSQSEGLWSDTATFASSLVLDGVEAGDPSTGTARVFYRDALLIIDLSTHDSEGIRILSPTTPTRQPPEQVWQAGAIAARWVYPFGLDSEWTTTHTERAHTEGGYTRDRQYRGIETAPSSRAIDLSWPAVPETDLEIADVGYVRTGDARVAERGTARALVSYVRHLAGEMGSLVYIPSMPGGSLAGRVTALLGRRSHVLGRLGSAELSQAEQPGSDYDGRIIEGGSMTIEEDV